MNMPLVVIYGLVFGFIIAYIVFVLNRRIKAQEKSPVVVVAGLTVNHSDWISKAVKELKWQLLTFRYQNLRSEAHVCFSSVSKGYS